MLVTNWVPMALSSNERQKRDTERLKAMAATNEAAKAERPDSESPNPPAVIGIGTKGAEDGEQDRIKCNSKARQPIYCPDRRRQVLGRNPKEGAIKKGRYEPAPHGLSCA
jgi:hypothetical protein